MKICMEFSYFGVDMMNSKQKVKVCRKTIWHLVAKEDLAFGQANQGKKISTKKLILGVRTR